MAQRTLWFTYDRPLVQELTANLFGPENISVTTRSGFKVGVTFDTNDYTDNDIFQAATANTANMAPCDPMDVEPPDPVAVISTSVTSLRQYARLERSAALSVSAASPAITLDSTVESSSAWSLSSGAAQWNGAANTPVRGHASVAFRGILSLTSVTVSVWKNRGAAGERLLGQHIALEIVVGGTSTVQVSWRALVSNGDKISVEAAPNGVLSSSLVVGGATHIEIG